MLWLQKKYANLVVTRFRNFSIRNNTYNFSCPYCGDSKKDRNKARGYLYHDKGKMKYKCHNCAKTASFNDFLREQDPDLFKQFLFEKLKDRNPTLKAEPVVEHSHVSLFGFEDITTPITDLRHNHPAVEYLRSRQIPESQWNRIFYLPSLKSLETALNNYKIMKEEPRILFPCFSRHKSIIGFICRSFLPGQVRYVVYKYDREQPFIFGLERVKIDQKIYVCEGPIDSLFLGNAMAAGGSDLLKVKDYVPKDNVTLIFDNEPRNTDVMRLMERGIEMGYKTFVWPDTIRDKDINAMIQRGHTSEQIIRMIDEHTFQGLTARMKFARWRKS
jgi:hypothetical protein